MTCAEFQELAAAYALGALDSDERQACDEHLAVADHEGCREALARAQSTVDALGDSVAPQRPPPSVWSAIEAKIGEPARNAARPRSARAAWVVAGLAVAAAAFAVSAAVRYRIQSDRIAENGRLALTEALDDKKLVSVERDQCRRELGTLQGEAQLRQAAIALLELPTTRLTTLEPQDKAHAGRGRALVNLDVGRGYLLGSGLVPVDGKTYELWVIREGLPPQSAGIFDGRADGSVVVPIDPELLEAGANAIAVSLEPGKTTHTSPTQILLVGAIPKT